MWRSEDSGKGPIQYMLASGGYTTLWLNRELGYNCSNLKTVKVTTYIL